MAQLFNADSKPKNAARLIGFANAIHKRDDHPRPLLEQWDVDKVVTACISRMGEAAFESACGEGQVMTRMKQLRWHLMSNNQPWPGKHHQAWFEIELLINNLQQFGASGIPRLSGQAGITLRSQASETLVGGCNHLSGEHFSREIAVYFQLVFLHVESPPLASCDHTSQAPYSFHLCNQTVRITRISNLMHDTRHADTYATFEPRCLYSKAKSLPLHFTNNGRLMMFRQ